jgi:hypothetical protein
MNGIKLLIKNFTINAKNVEEAFSFLNKVACRKIWLNNLNPYESLEDALTRNGFSVKVSKFGDIEVDEYLWKNRGCVENILRILTPFIDHSCEILCLNEDWTAYRYLIKEGKLTRQFGSLSIYNEIFLEEINL